MTFQRRRLCMPFNLELNKLEILAKGCIYMKTTEVA